LDEVDPPERASGEISPRTEAMTNSSNDRNEAGRITAAGEKENASTSIPPATIENKERRTHEHSHAAHLERDDEKPHTKPAIDMRESKLPGKRKQP
jgi:hypothetical protein